MPELVLRIAVALLVVLALMWAVARLARRPLSRRGGAVLGVLARQQLSRGSSVAVLRVLDRALVLGVTDQHVTLLGETDLAEVERQQAPVRRSAVPVDDVPGLAGPDPSGDPGRFGSRTGADRAGGDRLAGSALSRRTWSQAVEFLRDRTERRQ